MITKEILKIWHNEYVTSVSDPGWAVSLQTSMLLFDKLTGTGAIRVADFGSGFSSVVTRSFSDNLTYSVDHDVDWLEKTKEFLTRKGISTDGLMNLDEFRDSEIKDLDVSFYDLGNSKDVRWGNFVVCYERMKKGGVMILDDLHCKAGYLGFIESSIRTTSKIVILDETKDGFGRFAGLLLV